MSITEAEKEKRLNFKKNTGLLKADKYYNLNIKRYCRNDNSTVDEMMNIIEQHFKLI